MGRFLPFIVYMFVSNLMIGQIKEIDLLCDYEEQDAVYHVSIVIAEGSAETPAHRIQFNCQLAFVMDTSIFLSLSQRYTPLLNNVAMTSNTPMNWILKQRIDRPVQDPEHNYITVEPTLNPTAFYNNLFEGDTVRLFTLSVDKGKVCAGSVRFADPALDPPRVNGVSVQQGFTIGGTEQLYSAYNRFPYLTLSHLDGVVSFSREGDYYQLYNHTTQELVGESSNNEITVVEDGIYYGVLTTGDCLTQSERITITLSSIDDITQPVTVYPNPTQNYLILDNVYREADIRIVDILGRHQPIKLRGNLLDVSHLKEGSYILNMAGRSATFVKI